MPVGAPLGNTNGARGYRWREAINRALDKRSRAAQAEAIDELAEKLLSLCDEGDLGALRELGDRLDGKPKQMVDVGTSDPDRALVVRVHYGKSQSQANTEAEVALVANLIASSTDAD